MSIRRFFRLLLFLPFVLFPSFAEQHVLTYAASPSSLPKAAYAVFFRLHKHVTLPH